MAQFSMFKTTLIMLALFLVSPLSFAYSIHDHGELSAWFIHLLWLVPVALTGVYIALCVHRAERIKPNNELVNGVAKSHLK